MLLGYHHYCFSCTFVCGSTVTKMHHIFFKRKYSSTVQVSQTLVQYFMQVLMYVLESKYLGMCACPACDPKETHRNTKIKTNDIY